MKTRFKFNQFTSIASEGITKYVLNVDVCCVPKNIPMDCNPRLQNMNSAVVKGIKESLLEEDGLFFIFNRGITLTAESVCIDNDEVTIEFNDTETQGCIDGGHTYRSILDCQELLRPGQQQVTIEVLTGDQVMANFVKLAMARNRSQQVKDESLAELNDEFAWIKEIVKDEPFTVIYRENDYGTINIKHIIWIMTILNVRLFPNKSIGSGVRPNDALTNYRDAINKFGVTKENPFCAVKNILIDMLKLYDYLETNFAKNYTRKLKMLIITKHGNYKTRIYRKPIQYATINQFLFPILSSFRAIIGMDEETLDLYWKTDPIEFAKEMLPELREHQVNRYRATSSLDACRAKICYETLYNMSANRMGAIENERAAEKIKAMKEELGAFEK